MSGARYEGLKNIASAVQSFFFLPAAIVAGLFTIHTLNPSETEPMIEVEIEATSERTKVPEARYLKAAVSITNRGGRHTRIDFAPDAFRLVRLAESARGWTADTFYLASAVLSPGPRKDPVRHLDYTIVLAGETQQFEVVFPVDSGGLYLAGFRASVPESEEHITGMAREKGAPLEWQAVTFALVDE